MRIVATTRSAAGSRRNLPSVLALWMAAWVLTGAAPALACYSGLTIIPTAEVVGRNQYAVELQFDGAFPERSTDTRILNTQFGIGPRLEAGWDIDLSDEAATHCILNAKYIVTAGNERAPAVALGACNIGNNLQSSPYLVATHDFRAARAHLGAARIEGKTRWFGGIDRAVTDRLMLMADYTRGVENFVSIGAAYEFGDGFGVMAGAQFPNADGEDARFTVHFVFGGSYKKLPTGGGK